MNLSRENLFVGIYQNLKKGEHELLLKIIYWLLAGQEDKNLLCHLKHTESELYAHVSLRIR